MLSAHAPSIPGILVRDASGRLERIVESQDATAAEQRAALGITDGLVRISAGLEDLDDLQEDLAQALRHV